MLKRMRRLQTEIDIYQQEFNCPELVPTSTQWKQIEYLLDLTRPFMLYTNAIGKTRGPTIHNAFETYDHLFDHIEIAADRLVPKKQKWKTNLHAGLWAARDKLMKYYTQTNMSHGNIYACAALLDPSKKLTAFDSRSFSTEEKEGFVQLLRDLVDEYTSKEQQTKSTPRSDNQPTKTQSALARILKKRKKKSHSLEGEDEDSEVTRYLQEGKYCHDLYHDLD
jgi:hypothetical protein